MKTTEIIQQTQILSNTRAITLCLLVRYRKCFWIILLQTSILSLDENFLSDRVDMSILNNPSALSVFSGPISLVMELVLDLVVIVQQIINCSVKLIASAAQLNIEHMRLFTSQSLHSADDSTHSCEAAQSLCMNRYACYA